MSSRSEVNVPTPIVPLRRRSIIYCRVGRVNEVIQNISRMSTTLGTHEPSCAQENAKANLGGRVKAIVSMYENNWNHPESPNHVQDDLKFSNLKAGFRKTDLIDKVDRHENRRTINYVTTYLTEFDPGILCKNPIHCDDLTTDSEDSKSDFSDALGTVFETPNSFAISYLKERLNLESDICEINVRNKIFEHQSCIINNIFSHSESVIDTTQSVEVDPGQEIDNEPYLQTPVPSMQKDDEEDIVQNENDDKFIDYSKIEEEYKGVTLAQPPKSEQIIVRNSWRTTGIRRSGGTTSKLPYLEKALYQNLKKEDDKLLRKSIENSKEPSSEALAMYLLYRNGNNVTIRLLGERVSNNPFLDIATGPARTHWQDLPEVRSSGILSNLSNSEINKQEALFEILVTEASYVNSLEVLENCYMERIQSLVPLFIKKKQYDDLFSHIKPFIQTSHPFFDTIMELWNSDKTLSSICKLVKKHYENNRDIFIKYATHLETMLKTLKQLSDEVPAFRALLEDLADSEETNRLGLDSFLALPMQRVTRMPLLIKSVIAKADRSSNYYFQYLSANDVVEKLCKDCNKEVERMNRLEEIMKVCNEIDCKTFPLLASSRYLLHRALGKRIKPKKAKLEIFLFNDLFLVAKKAHPPVSKPLIATDYCPKAALRIYSTNDPKVVEFELLSNAEGEKETIVFEFDRASDCKRVLDAFQEEEHPVNENSMQVHIVEDHVAKRPDELDLRIGDVVVIITEVEEWYFGERIHDAVQGWFRSSCSLPIQSCSFLRLTSQLRRDIRNQKHQSHISLDISRNEEESLV